jgi:hypothetical protein
VQYSRRLAIYAILCPPLHAESPPVVVWLGNVGVKPKAPERVLLGNVEAWLEMYHQDCKMPLSIHTMGKLDVRNTTPCSTFHSMGSFDRWTEVPCFDRTNLQSTGLF